METYDDHLPARKFDNFQFVSYHDVLKRVPPGYNPDPAFATAALMVCIYVYMYIHTYIRLYVSVVCICVCRDSTIFHLCHRYVYVCIYVYVYIHVL